MIDDYNFETIKTKSKNLITVVKSEKSRDYIKIKAHVFGFGIGSFETEVKFIMNTITEDQLIDEIMSTIFGVHDNCVKDDLRKRVRENLLLSIVIGFSFWGD
ncbi:MAG: hypothetical protein ACRC92_27555 [Peptostreptococcaceae bacterium]